MGVFWNKQSQKWQAEIRVKGKQVYLGIRADEEEAAALRREALAALGRGELGDALRRV